MNRVLLFLIATMCTTGLLCGQAPTVANDGGSTTEIVVSLDGNLMNEDGSRAVGTAVYLRPKGYLAQVSAKIAAAHSLKILDSTFTDSLGHFTFDSIAEGTYMLECLEAEADNGALIDSVVIADPNSTVELATDTLKPLGSVAGQVQVAEGLEASRFRVMVYGLNRVVIPDSAGNYVISGLAEGEYFLRIQILGNPGKDVGSVEVLSGDTTFSPKAVLPGADRIYAPKASGTITVDGALDEADWANAREIVFSRPGFTENIVRVRTLWDSTNLYVAYDVVDTMLGGDTTDFLFNDDAAEFYLDPLHDPDTTTDPDTVLPISSTMNVDDIQIFINLNDSSKVYRGQNTIPVASPVSFAVDTTSAGYNMEISIPWSFIGKAPASGMTMGALFCNDDFDSEFVDQIDWLDLRGAGMSWKGPRLWGDLVLE